MNGTDAKPAYLLSLAITALMVCTSAGGIVLDDLYRDNLLATSGWLGNDLVTLLVAAPALVTALLLARRGSLRARLVWLGILAYSLYNYAFYLFGTAFNSFFLLYAVLLGYQAERCCWRTHSGRR